MNCELVYAFVPKGRSTLENIIKDRVNKIAEEKVAYVAHSMALEDQSVSDEILKMHKEILAKELMQNPSKKIWS
jgi:hypothetical protein